MQVPLRGNNVKDLSSQLHNPKTVLEPLVSRAGIEHVCHCQLVDLPKALNWW